MPVSDSSTHTRDYQRIEQAIHYLAEHARQQPGLSELAQHISVSEYHLQRLFTRWAGISPKRFLQFLTKEYAKTQLQLADNVLQASHASGLSGPGRLHDLFVQCEAVTPGEYKHAGEGLIIQYGWYQSPFGECLLASTERGICHLGFVADASRGDSLASLQATWPRASLVHNSQRAMQIGAQVFAVDKNPEAPLALYCAGTNFQIKVWEALLRIPRGAMVTYRHIAEAIGQPRAARAVGTAIGRNPIGYLIPCHRVIRQAGDIGSYHWGAGRKQAILAWEAAVCQGDDREKCV